MPPLPSTELTAEQRFQQIAAILAKGVIRCQRHLRAAESSPDQARRWITAVSDGSSASVSTVAVTQ